MIRAVLRSYVIVFCGVVVSVTCMKERQVAVEDESARCQNLISSTYMLVQLGLLSRSSIFDLMQLELERARDMYR
ncbi:hypothetical protein JOM56_008182 [Amanita muscaria]